MSRREQALLCVSGLMFIAIADAALLVVMWVRLDSLGPLMAVPVAGMLFAVFSAVLIWRKEIRGPGVSL